MSAGFRLQVYGRPAPQGSKRALGPGRMVEMSKYVKPWRSDVLVAARMARDLGRMPELPLTGPLAVRMVFTLARPAAARDRLWPYTMPDLSKLIRSTEDALSPDPKQDWSGAWTDDARVVEYRRAAKVYPFSDPEALEAPGVLITVTALTPQSADDLDEVNP